MRTIKIEKYKPGQEEMISKLIKFVVDQLIGQGNTDIIDD